MCPALSNPPPSQLQTSWPDISAIRENSLRHCTSLSFMKSWDIQFIYLGNSPQFFSVPFWDIFHCTASWGTWLMPRTIRSSWVSQLFLLACTPDGLLHIPSLLSQGSSFFLVPLPHCSSWHWDVLSSMPFAHHTSSVCAQNFPWSEPCSSLSEVRLPSHSFHLPWLGIAPPCSHWEEVIEAGGKEKAHHFWSRKNKKHPVDWEK